MRVGLAPLALFSGKVKLALMGEGAAPLHGAVFRTIGGFGGEAKVLSLPLGTLFAPVGPVRISFEDAHFAFSGHQCSSASGQIRLQMEGATAGGELGRTLIGQARCDRDAVATTLLGASGAERVLLRITPDGRYEAMIAIRPFDPAMSAKLAALGFRQTEAGMITKMAGTF
jgi:general secretion pathway protein N